MARFLPAAAQTPWRLYFGPCPGLLVDSRGGLSIDDEALAETTRDLADKGVALLAGVIEDAEIERVDYRDIRDAAARQKIAVECCPLPDFTAPDADFLRRWQPVETRAIAILRRGGGVAVHCLAGEGRSPLMAACLLVRLGLSPDDALHAVRAALPHAIETEEQLAFLERYGNNAL